MSKPAVLPEVYNGDKSWDEWVDHFDSVATLCEWDEASKLKWLRVRLTGRAVTAFKRLPDATRNDFKEATIAMRKRFEPESRKELYRTELQTRVRKGSEDWASFGEDLRLLADKAYPEFPVEARERFALNQYLACIDKPQVAFSVRQGKPVTVDEAISLTLEMESYMQTANHSRVAVVDHKPDGQPSLPQPIAAASRPREDSMQLILDRMDRLESKLQDMTLKTSQQPRPNVARTRYKPKYRSGCWNCGEIGHMHRDCLKPRGRDLQDGTGSAVSRACHNNDEVSLPRVYRESSEDSIPAFSISCDSNYVLEGFVNGVPASILADTGAAVTVLSKEFWDKAKPSDDRLRVSMGKKLVGVQGTPLELYGVTCINIELRGEQFSTEAIVAGSLTTDIILGRDFLREHECMIDMGKGGDLLHFNRRGMAVTLNGKSSKEVLSCINVTVGRVLNVPPQSELEVMGQVPCSAINNTWVLEGSKRGRNGVLVARGLVRPDKAEVPLRILNLRDETITIRKGTIIAEMELVPMDLVNMVATVDQSSADRGDEALWVMADRAGDEINQGEKEQLFALFLEYRDLFAKSPDDFGRTGKIKHTIHTEGCQPIRQSTRRISPAKKEEAAKLLKEMLDRNVIRPSSSPWASPVVLVQKKDGSTRFCIDYRRLNTITRKDAYPLPRVDDTLDTLSGSKWFSTLDLISGYWQVEMSSSDKEKTAFCTHEGLFEFQVMPFGLCNAPATFQRLMDMVLAGIQWKNCLVYLDDIIVIGRTFEEHLSNLREVFERLKGAGLRLKPSKCNFCSPQVEFLGHIVSRDGVHTDPRKTAKVAKWPTPNSKKEVQQFLGLANYYRRFVQDFSTIAKPLHRLTEKTVKFEWTAECQSSFQDLRHRLVTAPILAFPDHSRVFILDTDASATGIGAVLSQQQEDGTERVIAYASKVLTRPERQYCVTRRELLAVVIFIHQFRPYLLGKQFLLRTDHGSLTWLSNFKDPEGQLARWLERLQEYDFKISHRPGRKHQNADALSRRPCTQCGRESHEDPVCVVTDGGSTASNLVEKSPEELRQKQLSDGPIQLFLLARERDEKPNIDEVRRRGPSAQRLNHLWNKLVVKHGVLWRQYEDVRGTSTWLQLVVPHCLQEEILHDLHGGVMGGHLGAEKSLAKLKERFYWPGMQLDVTNWCRTCSACATRKTAPQRNCAPLQTIKAGYPMQVVAVDIMGPLPESKSGNNYVLVAGDYFTKWIEVYALPNQEAATVARKLTDEMFCRFSPPEQLHSDQGRQFESKLLEEICKLLQIRKTRTTPYHPQCDGLVERFNRTLLNMLATTTKGHPFDWEDQLPKVCMAYNSSVHSSTGYTPFFLMFGRQARMPVDIMYGTGEHNQLPISDYALQLKKGLEEAYHTVREKLATSHEHRKKYYDKGTHGRPFQDGELVWLHSTVVPRGKSRKLHHPWTGPFKVIKQLTECDYRIRGLGRKKKIHVVHFNRLKLCVPGTRFEQRAPEIADASGEVPSLTTPSNFGMDMELIDIGSESDEHSIPPTSRYPSRVRQRPDRFAPGVS